VIAGDQSTIRKKTIVVFTDGDDNASVLTVQSAVNRAKKDGVPLFSIAEGEAAQSPKLKKMLTDLSKSTGGETYEVKELKDTEEVFQRISNELRHMYLLSYNRLPNPPTAGRSMRFCFLVRSSLRGSR
jgi:hypothetical protein